MTQCSSCEQEKETKTYVIKDDLHGHKNVKVDWCFECKEVHTEGLSGCYCVESDSLLEVVLPRAQESGPV